MEKVDRLGWVAGFALKSYGVRIGVRSNDAATMQRVYEYLPAGWEKISRQSFNVSIQYWWVTPGHERTRGVSVYFTAIMSELRGQGISTTF